MKKHLLLFFLILTPIISSAQDKFAVFAGPSAVTISRDFLESVGLHSNSFTFHVGGLYQHRLSENIRFAPKLIYSQQGDLEDYEDNIRYTTKYLNVPVNFKFFSSPYITAGPQVGFLLDSEKRRDDYGDLESIDYGVNLGVGVQVSDFFIELNAYQGVNRILDVYIQLEDSSFGATNSVLQLSTGYIF